MGGLETLIGQTDEGMKRGNMWHCPDCGEKLEEQFDSCWKCAGKGANRLGYEATGPVGSPSKRKLGCLAVSAGLIFLVIFVFPAAYKFLTSSVYKSASPAGLGTAAFFKQSDAFVCTVDLYVKDYRISRFDLERVATVSGFENGPSPHKAVWSRDGTVVAVISGNVKAAPMDFWTHAYDFLLHKSYGSDLIDVESDRETSLRIKALLDARGGEGQVVLANSDSYQSLSRCYFPWELFPADQFP